MSNIKYDPILGALREADSASSASTPLTYDELVAKIEAAELVPETLYKLTDFATTHYMCNDSGVLKERLAVPAPTGFQITPDAVGDNPVTWYFRAFHAIDSQVEDWAYVTGLTSEIEVVIGDDTTFLSIATDVPEVGDVANMYMMIIGGLTSQAQTHYISSDGSWSFIKAISELILDVNSTVLYYLEHIRPYYIMTTIDAINTGAVEILLLKALTTETFYPEVHSLEFPNDVLGYDWNPANWIQDLGFGLGQESIIPNFKGVIYKRHDTLQNNLLGYDFRTVKFRRWKPGYPSWVYGTTYAKGAKIVFTGSIRISLIDDNTEDPGNYNAWTNIYGYDARTVHIYTEANLDNGGDETDFIEVLTFTPGTFFTTDEDFSSYERCVKNNTFSLLQDSQDQYWGYIGSILANNVFFLHPDNNYSVLNNKFGAFCELNTFQGYCEENTFGNYAAYNLTSDGFYGNTMGDEFIRNSFDYSCSANTFLFENQDGCFGNNCTHNYFGNSHTNIIMGSTCLYNTFGVANNYTVLAYQCQYNTFGNSNTGIHLMSGSCNNTFGNSNSVITLGIVSRCNDFGNENIKHNFTGKRIIYNTFLNKTDGTGIDYSGATHLLAAYDCIIQTADGGVSKLTYINSSGVVTVADIDD